MKRIQPHGSAENFVLVQILGENNMKNGWRMQKNERITRTAIPACHSER
jgi:hypothetical protein